jgi:hypothetical protein
MIISSSVFNFFFVLIPLLLTGGGLILTKKKFKLLGNIFLVLTLPTLLFFMVPSLTSSRLYVANDEMTCREYYVFGNSIFAVGGKTFTITAKAGTVTVANIGGETVAVKRIIYGSEKKDSWKDILIRTGESATVNTESLSYLINEMPPAKITVDVGTFSECRYFITLATPNDLK